MKKKLGIYDEVAYSYRLMQRLNHELPAGYLVYSFSEEKSFEDFCKREKPDILLVGEVYYSKDKVYCDDSLVVVLAESDENIENDFDKAIYKYQPVSSIVKDLKSICGTGTNTLVKHEDGVKFVGVYSPVRRCGKTSLAVAISKIYSRKFKVLYLNFEAFPAAYLPEDNTDSWNLSDVFYFMEQGKESREILDNAIIEYNDIYVIAPGEVPMDLQEISKDKWEQFFLMISDSKPADVVVIDFDETLSCYAQLLELCEKIYSPVLHDTASEEKMRMFENFLEKTGFEGIRGKIRKFDFRMSEVSDSVSYERIVEQVLEG